MGFLGTMVKISQAFESPEKKLARLKVEEAELRLQELKDRKKDRDERRMQEKIERARMVLEPEARRRSKKNNTDDSKNSKKYESEKEEEPEKDPKKEFVESTAFKSIRKEDDGTYSWKNKAVGRRTELQGRKLDMYKEHSAEQKAQQQEKSASLSTGAEASAPEM